VGTGTAGVTVGAGAGAGTVVVVVGVGVAESGIADASVATDCGSARTTGADSATSNVTTQPSSARRASLNRRSRRARGRASLLIGCRRRDVIADRRRAPQESDLDRGRPR
jgi:hypothetical protein